MFKVDNKNDNLGIFSGKSDFKRLSAIYTETAPFPHIVIDNILPDSIAESAHKEFPSEESGFWQSHGRFYHKEGTAAKFESSQSMAFPASLQKVVEMLNSTALVRFLKLVTGYDDLEHDTTLTGGGLNLVPKGGLLRVHADFNYSNELNAFRTVNLIYYLNKRWDIENGGCLELWDENMESEPETIVPSFNRAAIFNTNSRSYHGYKPVQNNPDNGRKSVNFYYYSSIPRRDVRTTPHKTLWLDEKKAN